MIKKSFFILFLLCLSFEGIEYVQPSHAATKTTLTSQSDIFYDNTFVFILVNNSAFVNFDHFDLVIDNDINYTGTLFNYYLEVLDIPQGTNNATAYSYDTSNVLQSISNTVYFQNVYLKSEPKTLQKGYWFPQTLFYVAMWIWNAFPYFVLFSAPVILGVIFLRGVKKGIFKG